MSEHLYIKDFKTLKVWQKANALEQEIGMLIKDFPKHEQYRLVDQLIRASRCIGANLAEGNSQLYINKEINFGSNAIGSAGEVRSHLITALQNNYISQEQYDILDRKTIEVIKMLYGYVKKLKSRSEDNFD